MFLKDETNRPEHEKNLRIATAESARGPFGEAGPPISQGSVWVERPTAVKIGDTDDIDFDVHLNDCMGAMTSQDPAEGIDISGEVRFPAGSPHCSVLNVSCAAIDCILGPIHTDRPRIL